MPGDDPFSARLKAAAAAVAAAPEQVLARLRPQLGVGAVYWVPDAWLGRPGTRKERPAAIVRQLVLTGPADIVLARPVQLSVRLSWKERFGPPPRTGGEKLRCLKEMGWLFTPAGLLPDWDRDGVFAVRPLCPIPLWKLVAARFADYMPTPEVSLLAACTTGASIAQPYPPSQR